MLGLMENIVVVLAATMFGALVIYCCWHGLKALQTGVVASPTMLSPGTTKRTDSPVSFWIQTCFWLGGAVVIAYNVVRWLAAVAEA